MDEVQLLTPDTSQGSTGDTSPGAEQHETVTSAPPGNLREANGNVAK